MTQEEGRSPRSAHTPQQVSSKEGLLSLKATGWGKGLMNSWGRSPLISHPPSQLWEAGGELQKGKCIAPSVENMGGLIPDPAELGASLHF